MINELVDHQSLPVEQQKNPAGSGTGGGDTVDERDDGMLDSAFLALADPVRRRIIARLSRGPATVNELAEPFEITKQAVSKHIQVLEQAQLVTRTRDAQRRPVHLNPARLEALTAWIDQYRLVREGQFRSLDAVLQSVAAARGTQAKDTS
ncbi:DNA-binding transcriptional ArsR family regulator [Arthrobacter sp. MP_M7]|nr:DNA-binding transcriptional ArsR family regulator [Arthrobacter sp. MP_M4]MEC5203636.1 DNA-binding transcriptional ArsR family regulator [Arthrobacter sp. MP_M7]